MTCITNFKNPPIMHIGKILLLPELPRENFETIKELRDMLNILKETRPKHPISLAMCCSKFPCEEIKRQSSRDCFKFSVINCTNLLQRTGYDQSHFSSPEEMLSFIKKLLGF